MHLHIPQTRIGPDIKLGIMGTSKESPDGRFTISTMVQFVLTGYFREIYVYDFLDNLEHFLKVRPSCWIPVGSEFFYPGDECPATYLFSLTVNGELRNPQAFLKSTARKFKLAETERRRQDKAKRVEREEFLKAEELKDSMS